MTKKVQLAPPFKMAIGALRAIRTIEHLKNDLRELRKELKQTKARVSEYEHALRIIAEQKPFLDYKIKPKAVALLALEPPIEDD